MRKNPPRTTAMEERLRKSAPPLRAPDARRVAKACAHLASAPSVSPLREPATFTKPLLRVAACLALLFGIALLMRPSKQAAPVPALPSMTFNDLAALMKTSDLENALASEVTDLASDLADLTAVLNDRTLAILF